MADPEQAFYRSEDSPSVRAEMRGQMQRLRSTEGHVAAFAANAAEVGTALTGGGLNSTPVERLLTAAELAQVDVGNTLFQLRDFADNFAHQVDHNVVGPLRDYHASIGQAMKLARAFDEDSEALDSAHLKYLSLSRDCATEARAHAHSDLCDKAAGVNLSLFDARAQLKEACAAQRMVPQRAVSQLLLAQLAYHQSCARLLTSIMPQISDLMARADAAGRGVAAERESSKEQRATMPQPQVSTLDLFRALLLPLFFPPSLSCCHTRVACHPRMHHGPNR
jgi:Arf-GAP/coiled-coil/ANK repeat/PH domain-containing protein